MRRSPFALILVSLFAATGFAQAQAPKPPDCSAPEHHQFDFWLGDWDVPAPDKQPTGHSHIESILAGCVIQENWDGGSGYAGKSFNTYNRDTKQWEQFWVDTTGMRLHLVGAFIDGKMVLRGVQDKTNAKTGLPQHERITWTPNTDGSVRHLWETSVDDGKTWSVTFDGRYQRAAAKKS